MTQTQALKSRMRKLGVLALICLGVLVAIVMGGSGIAGSMEEEAKQLENTVMGLQAQATDIRQRQKFMGEALPIYNTLNISEDKDTVSRARAAQIFDELRKNYALEGLKVDLGPVAQSADAAHKKQRAVGLSIALAIETGAYTDETVVAFFKELRQRLGGVLSVSEFAVAYTGKEYAPDVAAVSANFKASWQGIKQLPDPANAPAGEAGKP